jgi:hypothetical protein
LASNGFALTTWRCDWPPLRGRPPMVEMLIAEAAISDEADANPRRYDLGQANQHAAFVEAAPI